MEKETKRVNMWIPSIEKQHNYCSYSAIISRFIQINNMDMFSKLRFVYTAKHVLELISELSSKNLNLF